MKTLLVLNASGRVTRSITRRLTNRFTRSWLSANPGSRVIQRDLGLNPPPPINERWIASAFAAPAERSETANETLRISEALIEEIEAADTVLLGTPIYNFGMPAQLKAFFDQVVRVGRTFVFTQEAAEPYRPLLFPKPVIVVVSAGSAAMHPGGALAHANFLEPHLLTVLGFIGLTNVTFVRVGDEEVGGEGFQRSLATAEIELDELAGRSPARGNFHSSGDLDSLGICREYRIDKVAD
jgi:FMN-dependent NADH-azoreductase